jgi:hypothetical protein
MSAVLHVRRVLGRDDHVLHLDRAVVLVADRDLGLGVGAQPADDARLAQLGQLAAEAVGEHDRRRHHLGGLVAGVAEHEALVAGALLGRLLALGLPGVDALGDVRGLAGEQVVDENLVAVEHVVVVHVADVADGVAHDLLVVDLRPVVISPAITTWLDFTRVSHATRLSGSCARQASRTLSEMRSATLSGWPSPTDSEENTNDAAGAVERGARHGGQHVVLPHRQAPPLGERLRGQAPELAVQADHRLGVEEERHLLLGREPAGALPQEPGLELREPFARPGARRRWRRSATCIALM